MRSFILFFLSLITSLGMVRGIHSDRFLNSTFVYANSLNLQQPVTGTVRDSTTGEVLPGVTVMIEGTTTGVATDVNGGYSITVPDPNAILVFSYVGYQTRTVQAGGRTVIDVLLSSSTRALEEVVVIGYQTVRKRDLTGAVSVVDPSATTRITANSTAATMQGLASGVAVRNTGNPTGSPSIEIRGAASFVNTNPLYVIDGMIADANLTINTDDIESIQVLKDASASAIYGSRAANGVIIITTRQGKEGPTRVQAFARFGVQNIPKRWDLMNNQEFAAMQRLQYQNSGVTPPSSVTVGGGFDPTINTDWQKAVLRTGNDQDYNIALSGGTKNSTFLLSGSYYRNKGVLLANSFERGGFRINSTAKKGIVTIGENFVITQNLLRSPRDGNPFYDMPQMLPIIPVRSQAYVSATNPGGWGIGTNDAVTYAFNPVAVADITSLKDSYSKLVGNAYAEVKLMNWITYKFNTGVEASFDYIQNLRKEGIWQYNAAVYPSSVQETRARFLNLLFEHTLNFNHDFDKHSINGVVGFSQQHVTSQNTIAGRTNLQQVAGNYYTTIGSATGVNTSDGGTPIDYRTYGFLGRVNYTYNDKYLLTLTGRIDQDSRFGANYRTGVFPSIALAWRISKEPFFKVAWISDLKLRASYGELGIVPLGSWDYTSFINSNPRAIFGAGQTVNVGSTQAQLSNPDLRWESRITKNAGFDASFLNNQILLTFEVFNSLSKGALLQLPVGGYLGNLGGNPFINAGSIRNTGVEISATYQDNSKAFKWQVNANMTFLKNKVESVGNQGNVGGSQINYIQVGNTRSMIGRSLGEWYLIRTNGIFQSDQEIANYKNAQGVVIQPNAKPGDIRFVDKDGNGVIDNNDRDFVGSPWPKMEGGLVFTASYKGFDASLQFYTLLGDKIYNDVRRILDSYQRTNFRKDISPWSTTNTGTGDPRIALDTDQGIISNNRGESDRWLENGSFLRLRNIEIGYKVPASLLNRIKVQQLRIFISSQNLFTITKYKGLDPEVVGTDLYQRGLDAGNWPGSRIISAGVQLGF